MALTKAQEEVLCLLGMGEGEYLNAAELLVVDKLAAEGLAEWRGEAPRLTSEGCAELDRMLYD